MSREYIRWKERYESYEKEKDGNTFGYQEMNKALEEELSRMRLQVQNLQAEESTSPLEELGYKVNDDQLERLREEVAVKAEEIRMFEVRCERLEHERRTKDLNS